MTTEENSKYGLPARQQWAEQFKDIYGNHKIIAGVGKDEDIVTNNLGGQQSKSLYRFDLLHPQAMFEMTKVLEEGSKRYAEWNWLNIPVNDHINHLLIHAYAYLAGDESDEHLAHMTCRAHFAQGVSIAERK